MFIAKYTESIKILLGDPEWCKCGL